MDPAVAGVGTEGPRLKSPRDSRPWRRAAATVNNAGPGEGFDTRSVARAKGKSWLTVCNITNKLASVPPAMIG